MVSKVLPQFLSSPSRFYFRSLKYQWLNQGPQVSLMGSKYI